MNLLTNQWVQTAACYWFPVSPDDQGNSNNQSQHAQGQQDAQGDDRSLVGGGALRAHLYIKMKTVAKHFD